MIKPKTTISEHFSNIDDPRVERTKQHKLIDIITIAQRAIAVAYGGRPSKERCLTICAVVCGADTWVDIETLRSS